MIFQKKNIQNNEFTNLTTENFSLIQKENQNLNTTTNEIIIISWTNSFFWFN